MRWAIWLGVLACVSNAAAQESADPVRIESPGIDPLLRELGRDLAQHFPEDARQRFATIDLDGTDMRACVPAQDGLDCSYHLDPFGVAPHPERAQPYEMRTLWPAEATGPTIRYPRIAAFVAMDFVIRRLLPLLLRGAGLEADAARLASMESARTDAELAALEQEARRVFERLRALPAPTTREARRSLGRARTAVRVAWQSVGWLFRVHGFAMSRVFDRVVDVVRLAASADPEAALDRTVEMLKRMARVARSIRSWTSS
jgi:hypothetical protein